MWTRRKQKEINPFAVWLAAYDAAHDYAILRAYQEWRTHGPRP